MNKELTYEKAFAELIEITRALESNELEVDKLTEKVNRAGELLKFCKEKIRNVEESIKDVFDEE